MRPLSNETAEQRLQIRDDIIAAALLIGFAFFINRGIEIKGLYMDDLYLWSCYGEQSFMEYVFPLGSTRFRFLYYLAAWLELAVVGTHITWVVPVNILLNGSLAFFLYYLGRRLSGRNLPGFFVGILFLLSRMAYYQIGQMYGLMETMALWMAVGILWCLYVYLNDQKERSGHFYAACWLYFGVCFVHERYMALLPLFYLVLLLRRRFRLREWIHPTILFAAVQLIRLLTIGTLSPAGTGGTQVANTFSLAQAIRFALSQVAYIFGINAGPEYLNGLTWTDTPRSVKFFVYGADAVLFAFVIAFLAVVIRDRERRKSCLSNLALFLVFIALCIGSSSVTVRVEMRWVYVSYAAALLFLSYICGVLAPGEKREEEPFMPFRRFGPGEGKKAGRAAQLQAAADSAEANFRAQHSPAPAPRQEKRRGTALLCCAGFLFYLLLMVPVESFFRDHYENLYLWPNQMRYNSLAEETYGRYGDGIFGKTIYILGNRYEMSEFTAETFFKVFDPERKAEGTTVQHIESIAEIGLVTDQMLVLREDPENNGFQDITRFVRDLKLDVEYGLYDDGWLDEESRFHVLAGQTGIVSFTFMYPGVLSGGEETEIYVDGELYQTIPVTASVYETEIRAEAGQILDIRIENNFYMQNAQEQRGETRLATLVEITAD